MKKGLIKISNELYQNNWEQISLIFKDFKPNHIEFRHWENDVWYFYGVCDLFEVLKEGEVIPFYEVVFNVSENSSVLAYKFLKQ